jgi:hypothetical protein
MLGLYMNSELGGMWKEAAETWFELLQMQLLEELKKNTAKILVGIQTEIRATRLSCR